MFRATRYTYNLTGSQATLLKKIIGDIITSREVLSFFTHILNNPLVSHYIENQSNPREWFQTHGPALKELTMNANVSMSDALITFNGLTKAEIDTLAVPTLWARGLRPHHFKQGFKPEHAPVWIQIATEAEKNKAAFTIEEFLDEIKGLSLFETAMLGELWAYNVRRRHIKRGLKPEDAPIIREIVKHKEYNTYCGLDVSEFLEKSEMLTPPMRDSLVKYWKYGLRIEHLSILTEHNYFTNQTYIPMLHDSAFEVVKGSCDIQSFLKDVYGLDVDGLWLYSTCYPYRGWIDRDIFAKQWNRIGSLLKQHAPQLIKKLLQDPQANLTVNQAIKQVNDLGPEQLQLFNRYYVDGLNRGHVVKMGDKIQEYMKLFWELKERDRQTLKNKDLLDFVLIVAKQLQPWAHLDVLHRLLGDASGVSDDNVQFCITQLQDLDLGEALFLARHFKERHLRNEHVLALREFERTPLIKVDFGEEQYRVCESYSDIRSIAFMMMIVKSGMLPDVALSMVKKWDMIALFDYLKTNEHPSIEATNTAAKAAPTVSNQGFFASTADVANEKQVVQFNSENPCRQ